MEKLKQSIAWRESKSNALYYRKVLSFKKNISSSSIEDINKHFTDHSRLPHWEKVGMLFFLIFLC